MLKNWIPACAGMTLAGMTLAGVMLAGMLLSASVAVSAAQPETFAGAPRTREAVQVLHNPGFAVGYSAQRRQALWVAYRAASVRYRKIRPRPVDFEPDARVDQPVGKRAYANSGYDRGHLAPNYLIGKLYGRAGQRATFLMTNVSPQTARLDQVLWQRLEEAEADIVAPLAGDLPVLVGPIFGAKAPTLMSGVAVPEAFYRIWVDHRAAEPRVLAFVMPQNVCGPEPISGYVASVDEIEKRTGLDFFAELDDPLEDRLEAGKDSSGWELARYDHRRGRYADKFEGDHCAD